MGWIPTFNDLAKIVTLGSSGAAGKVVVSDVGINGDVANRVLHTVKVTYAELTNSVSFTEAENVRQVEIMCTAPVAVSTDTSYPGAQYVRMVLDAGTESVASAWFISADGDNKTTPVEVDKIPYNELVIISFTDYVTDIHFDPTIDNTHIGISAVGV